MSAKPSLLIILRSHERIRTQYYNGISQAFPELKVDIVSKVADADPYLADAMIIVTHGPHLEGRADHVFANAPKLKWVQGIGTGVDGIADRPTLRSDIIVTNIHGVHGAPMAEAAMMFMLALNRQFPRTHENKAKHKWENWPSRLLNGKTVGILGLGSIAESMAPRFKAFNMTVVGITSGVREIAGFDQIVDKAQLVEAVREFDYFIVLTPYTPSTHHMINAAVIGAMKPEAYLINLARGGVLEDEALIDAVKNKKIAGAALDVFEQEPLKPDSPLWDLDNVLITCHQAATHDDSARTNVPIINENIRRFLAGDFKGMKNIVPRA
ncbi:MAG TPA: D-2-hydroxyacid dehydrogenase [Xanthobacteraceae bacterium]|jgi:phosphoglycerate dehydrogenase-like enzyme|nr:D-2-hydroxyacid dehydrogenase [Xanthobacteraceae bacterium]